MSATATTRLGLIKPTPGTGEPVNVDTQINDSWDMIDYAIGTTICTNTTRPSSPFHGQLIQETNTNSIYYHNGATPASAGWVRMLTENDTSVIVCTSSTRPGSPSDGDMILETDTEKSYMRNGGTWQQIFMDGGRFYATLPAGGSTAGIRLYTTGTAALNRAIGIRSTSDVTDERWCLDYDGSMQWGPGNAAMDTNLYRSAANTLKTDDSLIVTGTLDAHGVVFSATYAGTTDASGFLVFTHGAPWTPVAGWAITTNPSGSFAAVWGIDNIGASSARVRIQNVNGTGPLASTAIQGRAFFIK